MKNKDVFIDSPEMKNDPRSMWYKRTNKRPAIDLLRVFMKASVSVLISIALSISVYIFTNSILYSVISFLIILLLIILLNFKKFVICSVMIYQRFAPEKLRNRCRFEPSCSEYMIKSVNKYGAFKGFAKGIGRITRCNKKGGGFDEP